MNKLFKKIQSKIEDALDDKPASSSPSASHASAPPSNQPPSQREIYRYRMQRGVNLGSWFTLENWLTPSLFQKASGSKSSEIDVLNGMDEHSAREMLEKHWTNFFGDWDWQWMVAHGINTVRIPVSYYHFLPGVPDHADLMKGTEYEKYASVYQNAWGLFLQAIQTAGRYQIGVLVDLHGAPGAQNNDSHSGLSTGHAGLWDSSKFQKRTIEILIAMARDVSRFDNVVGIELLNEPKNNGRLQSWYDETIGAIQGSGLDIPMYVSDSWDSNHYGQYVGNAVNRGVFLAMDHHLYRCFTSGDQGKSAHDHAREVHPSNPGGGSNALLAAASQATSRSIIVGEWSAALNPASFQSYGSEADKLAAQKDWGHAQWEAFEQWCGGYFFWTLKKEGGSDTGWCFYTAVEHGVLPEYLDRTKASFNTQRHSLEALRSRGAHESSVAMQQHGEWWASNSSVANQMEHWRFSMGYMQGWEDSLAFFFDTALGGSEVGFRGPWKKHRSEAHKREKGDSKWAWEYDHGLEQALGKFVEVVRS